MTSVGENSSRNLSQLWQFLDNEDSDSRQWNQMDENIGHQPTQKFLRPAMFGVKHSSADSIRSQNGLQMPTFANRYNGGIHNNENSKPTSAAAQAKKLPRTQVRNHEDSASDIYAMPSKALKSKSPVKSKEGKASFSGATGWPFSNGNDDFKTPSAGNENEYNMSSTTLFKRYEAGSIVSTISTDGPPLVYSDNGRKRIADELDDDTVIFARSRKTGSSKAKLWNKSRGKGEVGGRSCCTKKIALAVALAIIVIAGVVGIALGVSLSQSLSSFPGNSSKSSENVTTVRTVPGGTTSHTGRSVASTTSAILPIVTKSSTVTRTSSSSHRNTGPATTTVIKNDASNNDRTPVTNANDVTKTIQRFSSLGSHSSKSGQVSTVVPIARATRSYFSSTLKITTEIQTAASHSQTSTKVADSSAKDASTTTSTSTAVNGKNHTANTVVNGTTAVTTVA